MDHVFTPRSLLACLSRAPDDDWFSTITVPADGSWEVIAIVREEATYFVHREDEESVPRIIIIDQGGGPFALAPQAALRTVAQRVHWAAMAAQRPPLHLPHDWTEYHHDNLVAFFVNPPRYGNLRWIMETFPAGTRRDVCFWMLTPGDYVVLLRDFKSDRSRIDGILAPWSSIIADAANRFRQIPLPPATEALQHAIDLEAVSHGAVTRFYTYSQWVDRLTPQQKKFFDHPPDHALKLRGPAGSGKTLALELKLLREMYAARERGEDVRILFATHSWAMAEQVDAALHALDESGDLGAVEILPLVMLAQDRMPKERAGAGFRLLGEDSLSGKQAQLERIGVILDQIKQGDWLSYRSRVSANFRSRIESQTGTLERNAMIWDLMNEFSSVLSANGILPSINAERRYLAVQRTPWMMPISNDVEKKFVLRVYTDYVATLKADGFLSSDQLVNDYHNYLETFGWNLLRDKEGYDYIFVDELHLFGEQERLVLHYLTRSADQYPKLFMALDPRQSPNEVYAGFSGGEVASGESGEADRSLGTVEPIDLASVHRFSPEILALVRHLNKSFPALELGADWELDLEAVRSQAPHGKKPVLHRFSRFEDEMVAVMKTAAEVASSGNSGRTAIVLLDALLIPRFEAAAAKSGLNVCVIKSRDDVEQLRYRKRSIVLSAAEYVGGLQFEQVLVAGFVDSRVGVANLGYQMRRFFSLLYLAVSRSAGTVDLFVNDELGGVPALLESAIRTGLVDAKP
jgi:hypothetical protein